MAKFTGNNGTVYIRMGSGSQYSNKSAVVEQYPTGSYGFCCPRIDEDHTSGIWVLQVDKITTDAGGTTLTTDEYTYKLMQMRIDRLGREIKSTRNAMIEIAKDHQCALCEQCAEMHYEDEGKWYCFGCYLSVYPF